MWLAPSLVCEIEDAIMPYLQREWQLKLCSRARASARFSPSGLVRRVILAIEESFGREADSPMILLDVVNALVITTSANNQTPKKSQRNAVYPEKD